MMYKTVVLFETFVEVAKWYLVEGSHCKFNGVYVNVYNDPNAADHKEQEKLQEELTALMFDNETGRVRHRELDIASVVEEIKHGAYLIQCGFLP